MDVNKWVKELVGFPIYLFAGILGLILSDGNILIIFFVLVIAAAIYNSVYLMFFPDYIVSGKKNMLMIFFFSQISLVGAIIALLYFYSKL